MRSKAFVMCVATLASATALAQGVPSSPSPDFDAFLATYGATCAGPEGVEDCAAGAFEASFVEHSAWMRDHREALVGHWREEVRGGSHVPAYGLAYFHDEGALPALRAQLLQDRYFYGWETDRPGALAVRMRDEQYPHHLAVLGAIEAIAGMPAKKWLAATPAECGVLDKEAREGLGSASDAARWLSQKICP